MQETGERIAKPRIAVTMGDPCGVGPEVLVKALASGEAFGVCAPLVVGDAFALERAVSVTGAKLSVRVVEDPVEYFSGHQEPGTIAVFAPAPPLTERDIPYGAPGEAACRAVVAWIEHAVRMTQRGDADAVCTCPINKTNLHRHGFPFPGHTEFLQELTGSPNVVMMLAGPILRVALATIHEPLAAVPALITPETVHRTIDITGNALLRDFGLKRPRVAVAGLNPHAGEEGRFGHEEAEIIAPVVAEFQDAPFDVTGPYPPDTVYFRAFQGEFDAVVSMYHDQGLIALKLVHFHDGVNVSLGLPILRTSVDHGTAYDLAGTGKAHPGSMVAALSLASAMARNREAFDHARNRT